jgi:hypothetical protein
MMGRSFFWRRRIAGWFKVAFLCVSAVLVLSLVVIFRHVQAGTMFPKGVAYFFVGSLFVAIYLCPRFVGLIRNRMRIICDETGLELPNGRRIACERLKNLNLGPQSRAPVTVSVAYWPIPARIYLSCYEDSGDLFLCLREYSQQAE